MPAGHQRSNFHCNTVQETVGERARWAVRVREFGKELSVGIVRARSGFRQFRSSLTSSPASRSNTMIEFFIWGGWILGQSLYWSFFRYQTEVVVCDEYRKAYLLKYRTTRVAPPSTPSQIGRGR